MMPTNLNELAIPDDGFRDAWRKLADNSTRSSNGSITVHFRNLEQHLITHLEMEMESEMGSEYQEIVK